MKKDIHELFTQVEDCIVLPDLHYDDKSSPIDNEKDYMNRIKIIKEQIFPYMEEYNIKHIIQLGDFTTNRIKISSWIMSMLMEDFFDVCEKRGYQVISILGNHDLYYSDKRDVFTLKIFEKAYDNFNVIKDPTIMKIGKSNMLFVPWMMKDEDVLVQKMIQENDIDLILGHFEIQNFSVSKNQKADHGLTENFFRKIPVVSGHFHIPQETNNIHYIGLIAQSNWSDFNIESGFYKLNVNTLEKTFVKNTTTHQHLKVIINTTDKELDVIGLGYDYKVSINAKTDYSIFDNQKVKIFIDVDNAWNKKIIEKIIENVASYKIDITLKQAEVVIDEDGIEVEVKKDVVDSEYDIDKSIIGNLETDYQKSIFDEIAIKADIDMQDKEEM